MKMGSEPTKLDLDTARAFKKDLQEMLERESRGKAGKSVEKTGRYATPKGGGIKGEDMFGMLGGVSPDTPLQHRSTSMAMKRKAPYETPAVPKFRKGNRMSSPTDARGSENGNMDGVQ